MATNFLNYTKHAVAGSTKLAATTATGGLGIANIKISVDRDNGAILGKGEYVAPQYYAEADATTFTGKIIEKAANGNWYVEVETAENAYLLLQVPLIYEQMTAQMQYESNFYNAANDICRCYPLVPGDVFELSAEGFVGDPTKGAAVSVDADTKRVSVG